MIEWGEFLRKLKEAGGSTDMQTSASGRYPWLFHFCRGQADQMGAVSVYARTKTGMVESPPRDWRTKDLILSDYKDLSDNGGTFNDTANALAAKEGTSCPL